VFNTAGIGVDGDDVRSRRPHDECGNRKGRSRCWSVLIAIDDSAAAREAVQFGLELAAKEGAAVVFVHAVPAYDVLPTGAFTFGASLPHEPTASDCELLEAAKTVAAERGVTATTRLPKGHPADEIVACADSIRADMIVIGSRGHGSFASTLLGSVSRAVLLETRKPVLVVRAATRAPEGAAVAAGSPRDSNV
jgi:nucleotide-binding universal stress UspA family protein